MPRGRLGHLVRKEEIVRLDSVERSAQPERLLPVVAGSVKEEIDPVFADVEVEERSGWKMDLECQGQGQAERRIWQFYESQYKITGLLFKDNFKMS